MNSDQFSLLFQFSRLSNQQRVDQSSFVERALPSKETLSTKIMVIFLLWLMAMIFTDDDDDAHMMVGVQKY